MIKTLLRFKSYYKIERITSWLVIFLQLLQTALQSLIDIILGKLLPI